MIKEGDILYCDNKNNNVEHSYFFTTGEKYIVQRVDTPTLNGVNDYEVEFSVIGDDGELYWIDWFSEDARNGWTRNGKPINHTTADDYLNWFEPVEKTRRREKLNYLLDE